MKNQIVATFASYAGGVGKTTICLNVAYLLAFSLNKNVTILDLDGNLSLNHFTGVAVRNESNSTELIFQENFVGQWMLESIFESEGKVTVFPSREDLSEGAISIKRRKEYILEDALDKYPIEADVVLIDTRGGGDLILDNAINASTHVIIPVEAGAKASTIGTSIQKVIDTCNELRKPQLPKILVVANKSHSGKISTTFVRAIKNLESANIRVFEPIKLNKWIDNCNAAKVPIADNRPGESCNKVYLDIAKSLIQG